MADGSISAVAPGGLIQYHPEISVRNLAKEYPQMTTVLDTLEDFRYDLLESQLSYDDQAILQLKTRIRGYNPSFENGRIINFNLNIEEDVQALLDSLRLSDEITRQVDERFKE